MNRQEFIKGIADESKIWDYAVIGGGATGLGVALDALLRGFSAGGFYQRNFQPEYETGARRGEIFGSRRCGAGAGSLA